MSKSYQKEYRDNITDKQEQNEEKLLGNIKINIEII